ncbi:hypothetical protein Tco_0892163 [Tanacetum coccineum]|uniref:Solute carrier family 40 protein n=1 Tax=Tanacetum coccineum TaxID=301880 RepID=A0ABQ5C5D6_9ASTR
MDKVLGSLVIVVVVRVKRTGICYAPSFRMPLVAEIHPRQGTSFGELQEHINLTCNNTVADKENQIQSFLNHWGRPKRTPSVPLKFIGWQIQKSVQPCDIQVYNMCLMAALLSSELVPLLYGAIYSLLSYSQSWVAGCYGLSLDSYIKLCHYMVDPLKEAPDAEPLPISYPGSGEYSMTSSLPYGGNLSMGSSVLVGSGWILRRVVMQLQLSYESGCLYSLMVTLHQLIRVSKRSVSPVRWKGHNRLLQKCRPELGDPPPPSHPPVLERLTIYHHQHHHHQCHSRTGLIISIPSVSRIISMILLGARELMVSQMGVEGARDVAHLLGGWWVSLAAWMLQSILYTMTHGTHPMISSYQLPKTLPSSDVKCTQRLW